MENINKAVELNNNDFEAHRMLAEVHLSLHDFDKALLHGTKAFQLNPNDPRVTSVYGEILVRVKKIPEGLDMLEKAYELDPVPQGQSTSDKRISALITGYYLSNNLERCIELFKSITDIDFRSWLMVLDININHENKNLDSIKMHSKKFKEIDYNLEIDRFHLNDKILKDSLIKRAKEELFA
jgi:tetratricopeptide (TPR) repeat protein